MNQRLTEKLAKSLGPLPSGNKIYFDAEIRGLGLRVTKAGTKSFVLNYRIRGRERRYTIGPYPEWSVKAARAEAMALRQAIGRGIDVMGERVAERRAPTMQHLCERYLKEHAIRKAPRGREADESMINQHIIPKLGSYKVAEIQFADIDALHRLISKLTPYRANRVLALLSKMFALAIRWQQRSDNPAKGVQRNPEVPRNRFMSEAELARLTCALDAHPNQSSANAVRILVLTGARRGEVLSACWDQFDLDRGIWTKPSAHTKQKREHRVPLSSGALSVLNAMYEEAKGSYLFPGHGTDAPQRELKKFWAAVCREADLQDLRIHDLRHTYASILASAGASLPIIGALLGHTQPMTTARYSHLFESPLREATEKVGLAVAGAASGKGRVVNLKPRRHA